MAAIDRPRRARWLAVAATGVALVASLPSASRAEDVPSTPSTVTKKAGGEIAVYGDSDAVQVLTSAVHASAEDPLSGWSARGSYLVDVVSAASVDIVSTASSRWTEVRHAATAGGGYKRGAVAIDVSGATSSEPDYLSLSGGADVSFELDDKMVLPSFAYAYGHDTAGKTGTPFSVYALHLERHTFDGGAELVLDRSSTLSLNASLMLERGHQEKPYRYLPVFSPAVASTIQPGASLALVNEERLPGRVSENLPDERRRFAVAGRFARRMSRATFVINERLYADDWGLKATTTDLLLVFDVGQRLEVAPHLRGHVQSGVDFWRTAYAASVGPGGLVQIPVYRTGDRELSALSTGTAGLELRYSLLPLTSATSLVLGFQSDLMVTVFHEALFVRDRQALLSVLQAELQF